MKKNLLALFFVFSFFLNAYSSSLISGPMLGYVEHREVLIWMEVATDVKKVQFSCTSPATALVDIYVLSKNGSERGSGCQWQRGSFK